jgi:uncharacterized protein (DUF1015 family)
MHRIITKSRPYEVKQQREDEHIVQGWRAAVSVEIYIDGKVEEHLKTFDKEIFQSKEEAEKFGNNWAKQNYPEAVHASE